MFDELTTLESALFFTSISCMIIVESIHESPHRSTMEGRINLSPDLLKQIKNIESVFVFS